MRIPNSNDLVRTLLTRRMPELKAVTRQGRRLQHGRLLGAAPAHILAANEGKLEGRGAAKLEQDVGRAALVDIGAGFAALADAHAGQRVHPPLAQPDRRRPARRCAVLHRRDPELACPLREPAEGVARYGGLAGGAAEVVEDGERGRAG